MKGKMFFLGGLAAGLAIVFAFALLAQPAESGIPPTNAFRFVNNSGSSIGAENYTSTLFLSPGERMDLDYFPTNNTVRFSSEASAATGNSTISDDLGDFITTSPAYGHIFQWSASSQAFINKLFNIPEITCPAGQFINSLQNDTISTCGTPTGSGNSTVLNDLGDVANSNTTKGNIFASNGNYWSGVKVGSNGQVLTADSSQTFGVKWATSGGSGNATFLNDLGDVVISSPSYGHIIQYSSGLGAWINKLFRMDTLTPISGFFVTGINNQTGSWTTKQFAINNDTNNDGGDRFVTGIHNTTGTITSKQFSVNTVTANGGDLFVNAIDNATGNVNRVQFSVNTQTCSGTDKVSAINNATGQVTCSADQTGAGGSGIPFPQQSDNVKAGGFFPTGITDDAGGGFWGILADITSDGTQAGGDDTDGYRWSTPVTTTAGTDGGIQGATALFHREWNADMRVKVQQSATTGHRIVVGFTTQTTLPNSNTPCASASCAMFVIDSDDTVWSIVTNSGDASETRTACSSGCAEDTNVHFLRIRADASGNQFCFTFDAQTEQCVSTDVPAATTDLFLEVEMESAGSNNSIEIYSIYAETDK